MEYVIVGVVCYLVGYLTGSVSLHNTRKKLVDAAIQYGSDFTMKHLIEQDLIKFNSNDDDGTDTDNDTDNDNTTSMAYKVGF